MPTLVRPWIVTYLDAVGHRVPKGTRAARKSRTRSAKWYGQGIPGLPPKKLVPLATDKVVARRMLDDMVRGAERSQVNPARRVGRPPATDRVTDRVRTRRRPRLGVGVPPGTEEATGRGCRPRGSRVRGVLAGCEFVTPADLNDAAPAKLAEYLDTRAKLAKKDGGLFQQTAAFYLAAARRFAWWLSARAKAPVRTDLFDGVPGFEPMTDRRHDRRDITPRELAAILDAARSSQREYRDLTGEDRYHLYRVAFATGFRAGEGAVLCPESFELDAAPPVAVLPAKHTNNKKPVRQPLPPGVAEQLRSFLRGKPAGRPVWPGTWAEKPVKILRVDLVAAGVPYSIETVEGPKFADFHALQHTYLSSLAASGVGPKEL